jgi:hypothetical protein
MQTTHRTGIRKLLFAMLLLAGSSAINAETQVSFSLFYNSLAPYGTWLDHPRYNRVWYPHNVPHGWRPYTHGHWSYTQLHGWMWVSDWEWGWAPFHYGRWAFDDHYGWIWIPGDVWGPGWVDDTYGLINPAADDYYGINVSFWIFIGDRDFLYPHLHRHIYLPTHNTNIIRITSNITNVTYVNRRVVNQCLPVRHIEQVTRQPVRIHHVHDVDNVNVLRQPHREADVIRIYRPPVRQVTPQRVPPNRSYPQTRYPDNEIRVIETPLLNRDPRRQQEQPIKVYPQNRQPETYRHDAPPPNKELYRQQEQPIKRYPQSQQPPQQPRQPDSRRQDERSSRESREQDKQARKQERQEDKQIRKNEQLFR